jgi:4-hydroxy-3-methylbut-2-enyl diphosphate reductase
MNVYVTNPHGYCMGVVNAIKIAEQTKYENPTRAVAILGMLVHNEEVIKRLQKKGIFTIYDTTKSHKELLQEINPATIIIFSAHGHVQELEEIAKSRGLTFIDATCSRVTRNHDLIRGAIKDGKQVIFIGKKGHPETTAAISIDPNIVLFDVKEKFDYHQADLLKDTFVLNQTTLSFLELKPIHNELTRLFDKITVNEEICSATRLRQQAVMDIPAHCDLIYIVGSSHSSNTEKLVEVAKKTHPRALVYRINALEDIHQGDLTDKKLVAVAAGASTPPELTDEIIAYLRKR